MSHLKVDYRQPLLKSNRWKLVDPSGVIDTYTDGDGYTDFVTNAVAGTAYLVSELVDFHGQPIDASNTTFTLYSTASMSGGVSLALGDRVMVGTSDNANPLDASAKFDIGGVHYWTASEIKAVAANEAGALLSAAVTADRTYYGQPSRYGETDDAQYVYAYSGSTGPSVGTRSQGSLPRAYVPTHIVVAIRNVAASVKTIRANVGFHVHRPVPALQVTAAPADNSGRVWFYPDDDGTLEEVTIPCWTSLDEIPLVNRRTARSYAGKRSDVVTGGNFQVRAVIEQFNSDSVLTGLFGAQNQLFRGRTIGLCADASKAWAGFAAFPPRRGDTTVRILGTGTTFQGSGSLAAGDFVIIQTVDEDPIVEMIKVTAVPANNRFTCAGVMNTFPSGVPILVRHRYYWPAVWLDDTQGGQELLTSDHGLNYTFDALLTEDLGALQALTQLGATGTLAGTQFASGRATFATLQDEIGKVIANRLIARRRR